VTVGEFLIGSEESPFLQKAEIELLGATASDPLVLDGSVKGGNKIIATSNLVSFHGKKRSHQLTRLLETV